MGVSRQSVEQQRKFLMNVAGKYQDAVRCAIDAQYGRNDFLQSNGAVHLAKDIVNLNEKFARRMSSCGQYVFWHTEGDADSDEENKSKAPRSVDEDPQQQTEVESEEGTNSDARRSDPGIAEETWSDSRGDDSGLGDAGQMKYTDGALREDEYKYLFNHDQKRLMFHYDDLRDWLENEYRQSRGFELGTFNPSILPNIFGKVTCNWELLTMQYLESAVKIVHGFSRQALRFYIPDEKVSSELWAVLLDDFRAQYSRAREQLQFLLASERSGTLMTTNHYFAQNLNKMKKQRIKQQLKKHSNNAPFQNPTNVSINIDRFADDERVSNDEHTVRTIHDILRAYYKVALKRFVDNVCMQGTDHHLISGPSAVLYRFCPEYVLDMSPSRLEAVAGEDSARIERRGALTKEIEALKAGKAILVG